MIWPLVVESCILEEIGSYWVYAGDQEILIIGKFPDVLSELLDDPYVYRRLNVTMRG